MIASYYKNGVYIASFDDDPDNFMVDINLDVVDYTIDSQEIGYQMRTAFLTDGRNINMFIGLS